jgi:hypothetical protein
MMTIKNTPMNCPACGKSTYSLESAGGAAGSHCGCMNTKQSNVSLLTKDEQLIDALKTALSAKDELIANLKAEIERLRSLQTPIFTPPGTLPYPMTPGSPGSPYVLPTHPGIWPAPWYGITGEPAPVPNPAIVTVGDSVPVSHRGITNPPHSGDMGSTTVGTILGSHKEFSKQIENDCQSAGMNPELAAYIAKHATN